MISVASPPPRLPSLSPPGSLSTEHSSAGFTALNSTESPSSRVNGVSFYHEKETFSEMSEVDHRRGVSGGSPAYSKINGHNDHASKKRKGSSSYDATGDPATRYDYSPPRRHDQPHQVADRVLSVLGDSKDNGDPVHVRTQTNVGIRTDTEQWRQDDNRSRGEENSRNEIADNRMAEALQQATHEEGNAAVGSPTTDKESADGNSPQQLDALISTTINGKRKRMFSNRTKTGCITCRKRKKKCDERQPFCKNCDRGGFSCEGYTNSREMSWRVTDQRTSILSQGRESFHDVQNGPYQPKVTPIDPGFAQSEQQPHGLPSAKTENAGAQLTLSPQSAESRGHGAYSGHSWPPQHGHAPYTHRPVDHLPPFSEMASRPDVPPPTYSHAPLGRDMSRIPPPQSATQPTPQNTQWQTHPGPAPPPQDYRPTYAPQRVETIVAQPYMAPRASTSGYSAPTKSFGAADVERSKMLRRAPYKHLDATLENERQRCEEACKRYNDACTLRMGVSREATEDMLRKIFDPALDTSHRMVAQCVPKKGQLGPGVRIEAPFSCTYGYNISMYDNAFVGKGCEFDDAALIRIGARTWIGPNVTIFTADLASKDLIDRRGTESEWIANHVNIGDEVVIGRNAVIYPGVTIGRGSTVEPGAVVKSSVGDNQIVVACGGQIRAA